MYATLVLGVVFMVFVMGSVEVRTTAVVARQRSAVWRRALDVERWERMSDAFAVSCDACGGGLRVGALLHITSSWSDGTSDVAVERVTVVEPERRLCWDFERVPGGPYIPDLLLRTDRCILLEDGADGRTTRVTNYVRFSGPIGLPVGVARGGLIREAFGRWNEGLRRRCERFSLFGM